MTRFVRLLRSLAVVALTSSLALPALAQQAAGSPGPPPVAPPTPPPTMHAEQMPSLAPSPLLEEGNTATTAENALDRDPRALTYWNQDLAPYGTWVDDPSYGRVWVPDARVVGSDFTPYASAGHWALDQNEAWVWVSDYPFGNVVFHYGRWVWTTTAGWAWIPGLQYAPAWVAWRTPVDGYAYVGWAPYPPSWVWFGGISVWYGYGPYYPWVYCSSAFLFYPHVHYYLYTDPYYVAHAAQYTRPYYPANPTPANAAPASPGMRAAAVPSVGVPRERVSSQDLVSSAPGARNKAAMGLGSRTSALSQRADLVGGGTRSGSPGAVPLAQGSSRRPAASSDRRDLVSSGARTPRLEPASSTRSFRPERMGISRSAPRLDAPRMSSPMRSVGAPARSGRAR